MRSKLNRKRVDVRIPHWFRETIASIEEKYQLTFTEALIRCGEKGAAYYEKQWAAKQKQKSQADAGSQGSERCPDESPDKNIPHKKMMTEEEREKKLQELEKRRAEQKAMEKYEANIEETIRIAKTPWVPED